MGGGGHKKSPAARFALTDEDTLTKRRCKPSAETAAAVELADTWLQRTTYHPVRGPRLCQLRRLHARYGR